jgi:hypothetical protein
MNKSGLSLVLLSLVFVSSLMFVSAAFLDEAVPASASFLQSIFQLGETWKEVIIGLIFLAIIISGVYDILLLTSIFSDKSPVKIIISVGLGLVFALTGMVNGFTTWMLQFAAAGGVLVIVIEIVVSLLIFFGLSIGSYPIAKWAAKRQANVAMVNAVKESGKTAAGAEFLKELYKREVK